MTLPFILYYGQAVFHMTRDATLCMRYGEFMDMLTCHAIYNGHAKEIKRTSFDDIIAR